MTARTPNRDFPPSILREFAALVSVMSEALGVVLEAAERADRGDLVAVLLRGRQELAVMRRDLLERGGA